MTRDISDIQAIIENLNYAREQKLKDDPLFYYLNFEQIRVFSEQLSEAKNLLTELILAEYETEALIAKNNGGKPITRRKDNFNIRFYFPEYVSWRQEGLKNFADKIREQGFPAEEHIDTYYSISPERWNKLDRITQAYFETYRIVKLGEPVIELSPCIKEE